MGIREQLNQNSTVATGAAAGAVVLGLVFIVFQAHARRPSSNIQTLSYYSDDDGATYFEDSLTRLPPFDHGGKPAVAANIFECKGGPPFVGYLQRYTAKGLKEMQSPGPGNYPEPSEMQISRPLQGETGWVSATSSVGVAMIEVKCPGGGPEVPEQVHP